MLMATRFYYGQWRIYGLWGLFKCTRAPKIVLLDLILFIKINSIFLRINLKYYDGLVAYRKNVENIRH